MPNRSGHIVSQVLSLVQHASTHLRQIYERWPLCHVLRLGARSYSSFGGMVEIAEQLLLLWRR
jgi:hypothetical protein